MPIPIFIEARTPQADPSETVSWTDSHLTPEFYWIDHDGYRETSRWTSVERKRKFRITHYKHGKFGLNSYDPTYHATLNKAKQHAAKLNAEEDERKRKAEYERTRPRWTREYTITVKVTSFTEDGSDVTQDKLTDAIRSQAEEAARIILS
jgi:hypothetical protein